MGVWCRCSNKKEVLQMKKLVFISLACLLIFCCGDGPKSPMSPETPKKNLPVINYFRANPIKISCGASSTLSWQVTNATKVEIDQGIGGRVKCGRIFQHAKEKKFSSFFSYNLI